MIKIEHDKHDKRMMYAEVMQAGNVVKYQGGYCLVVSDGDVDGPLYGLVSIKSGEFIGYLKTVVLPQEFKAAYPIENFESVEKAVLTVE